MARPTSVQPKTLSAITVASAGSRQALSATSVLVYSATVQSLSSNTGTQYIGDSTVTSANGQSFGPGDVVDIKPPQGSKEPMQVDLSEVYVDSSTAGAEFRISACIRR